MKESPKECYLSTLFVSGGTNYVFSSPSEDTETVSNSSEGKCGSPHDLLETIFIRKVGAFVNKPINQVMSSRSSQRAP